MSMGRIALAAVLAAACAAPVPPGALTPIAGRNTNEARAVDLAVFDAWDARLATLMAHAEGASDRSPGRLRSLAAADAWLAFARDEYVRLPSSPIVDETFALARSGIEALEEGRAFEGDPRLVVGTERRNDTLWTEFGRLAAVRDADPVLLGETAVLLVRAGRVPMPGDTLSCDPAPFAARARRNLELLAAAARPTPVPARRPPLRSVYFAFDSDTISAVGRQVLDRLAGLLDRYPGVRMELDGLADPRGSREYNVALAHRRALAIQQYLAARTTAITAFEVRSLGAARTEADLGDFVGLARDRRVDLRVVLPDGREVAREEAPDSDLQVEPASARRRPARRP